MVLTNSGGLPLAYALSFTNTLPAWLSLSSTNGFVSKASALTIALAFNPAGLAPGTYTFTLFLHTGDPALAVTTLPVSFSVLANAPVPRLLVLTSAPGQLVLQLQGGTNASYIVQTATNLWSWAPVSTNVLPNGWLNLTNLIPAGAPQQFWRALWEQ